MIGLPQTTTRGPTASPRWSPSRKKKARRFFAPLSRVIAELADAVDPDLTAASILSLVAGHYQLSSTFVHLPRELRALSQVDSLSEYVKDFVHRSLGLSNPSEAAP